MTVIKDTEFRILFWNSRSLISNQWDLQRRRDQFDIVICVESWLASKDHIHLPGFLTLRKDRPIGRGGGILFLIRKSIVYNELDNLVSPDVSVELCGIRINNVQLVFDLIACYRSPGRILSETKWNILDKNCLKNSNTLLVGDFNSHSSSWNCLDTDKNGEGLETIIDDYNLFLHNSDTTSYLDMRRNYKSNLDLVLSTIALSDKINVVCGDDNWGSDHFPLFINYSTEKDYYFKKTFKLYTIRTDWQKFDSILENSINAFYSQTYRVFRKDC